jgi:hypothetical protein
LRNLNKNKRVKEIKLRRKIATNEEINFKGAAYAEDISVIFRKSTDCIQQVIYEYERLTKNQAWNL